MSTIRNDKLKIASILFLFVYGWSIFNYWKLSSLIGIDDFRYINWLPTIVMPSLFIIGNILLFMSRDLKRNKK